MQRHDTEQQLLAYRSAKQAAQVAAAIVETIPVGQRRAFVQLSETDGRKHPNVIDNYFGNVTSHEIFTGFIDHRQRVRNNRKSMARRAEHNIKRRHFGKSFNVAYSILSSRFEKGIPSSRWPQKWRRSDIFAAAERPQDKDHGPAIQTSGFPYTMSYHVEMQPLIMYGATLIEHAGKRWIPMTASRVAAPAFDAKGYQFFHCIVAAAAQPGWWVKKCYIGIATHRINDHTSIPTHALSDRIRTCANRLDNLAVKAVGEKMNAEPIDQ